MDRLVRLGDFLRSRRARLQPVEAGTVTRGRRRVPGLRREELARLAGLSVDYYTRLEQGRSKNASPAVLDAIARALRLDEAEREHLVSLASPLLSPGRGQPRTSQNVRPETYEMLDTLERAETPSCVIDQYTDVLAANRVFRALMMWDDPTMTPERNLVKFAFRNPRARDLYLDWNLVAADATAMLRFTAGRYPDDRRISQLIGELMSGEDFRRVWGQHHVYKLMCAPKRYHHHVAGDFMLSFQVLALTTSPDQNLCAYTAKSGSPSASALRLLAEWAKANDPRPPNDENA
ncbi:helix-turn-helix transcriptional regulator [Planotetraspora mira]|uniref:Transcriptional regulator n=1 Tax=Planotetraspora mira TaxID=58121 RepID=A0A8J3XFP0_9ACTN|nr:helix-turn-helix transcriptional regulator [Planotetraspora mira]GII34698.1 transcriptional regulator [Planotetraspora mira]